MKPSPLLSAEVAALRSDTAGVASRVHLNNAGAALMPRPVAGVIHEHLERETMLGGYEAAEAAHHEVEAAYEAVAQLIGATRRCVAFVENATVAFAQAMSAFRLEPGDAIVTTRNDYISNQLLFLSLAARWGIVVRRADDLPEGGVDPDSFKALVTDPRCKVAAVTWVPTNSGLVQPVEAIGEICDHAEVPYVIDACQAVGQLPVDVSRLKCDYLSATARKFLRGPRGAGFLFVSERALERGDYPLFPDMQGARWAAADAFELAGSAMRFENWEFAYALVLGMGAAARYALDVGVERGGQRAAALAERVRQGLAAIDGVRVLDRGARLAAIATAEIARHHGNEVVQALRQQGINTSSVLREYAVLDMTEKRAASGVRISPHYYNTEAEIDQTLDAIRAIAVS